MAQCRGFSHIHKADFATFNTDEEVEFSTSSRMHPVWYLLPILFIQYYLMKIAIDSNDVTPEPLELEDLGTEIAVAPVCARDTV